MLLGQMLRTMRESGSWKEEGEEDGFGADALFETLDAELSRHLSKAQGFGLAGTLMPQLMGMRGAVTPGDAEGPVASQPPTALPVTPQALTPALVSGASVAAWPTPGVAAGETVSPLDSDRTVTSAFGWRRDPFTGGATYHRGVDLRAAYGEPVSAMAGGRVVFAGAQGGYGNTVVLEHANGVRSRYAHLSSILVGQGTEVAAGDSIGRAGRSGRATGTHLHFEVTQDGRPVDPERVGLAPLKPERMVADLGVGQDPSGRQGGR